jgi:hypothetical protein
MDIYAFARRRFDALADQVIATMKQIPATGIHGDDAGCRTLLAEWRREVEGGGALAEAVWQMTLDAIIMPLVEALPPAEARILYLSTEQGGIACADDPEGADFDTYWIGKEILDWVAKKAGI